MRVKLHFKVLILALIILVTYGYIRLDKVTPVKLPEISFYDKLGQKITLDDFRGRVVLVNLWASWCAPCVEELPSLGRLQGKLPEAQFKVVAISMDKLPPKGVRRFLRGRGAGNLDVYKDKDRQVPLKWKYEGLPTSFLIDRNGIVVKQYDGPYEWDKAPLLEEVRSLLK